MWVVEWEPRLAPVQSIDHHGFHYLLVVVVVVVVCHLTLPQLSTSLPAPHMCCNLTATLISHYPPDNQYILQ